MFFKKQYIQNNLAFVVNRRLKTKVSGFTKNNFSEQKTLTQTCYSVANTAVVLQQMSPLSVITQKKIDARHQGNIQNIYVVT